MAELHQKILIALRPLGDFVDGLNESVEADRVSGVIISHAFDGQTHHERQRRLRALLDAGLTRDEQLRLGPIATLTPAETRVAV